MALLTAARTCPCEPRSAERANAHGCCPGGNPSDSSKAPLRAPANCCVAAVLPNETKPPEAPQVLVATTAPPDPGIVWTAVVAPVPLAIDSSVIVPPRAVPSILRV